MEEIQNEMRVNQSAKNTLRNHRAIERMAQRKNYSKHNPALMPLNPDGMPPSGENMKKIRGLGKGEMANEAGMQRVIGRGKKAKAAAAAAESDSSDGEMEGGRKYMGKMLAKHLVETHGGRYFKKFLKGMGLCGEGGGIEVTHAARMNAVGSATGGQDVPPGGVAPIAYGSPPQAPASFKRNSVGMGRCADAPTVGAGRCAPTVGAGNLTITHEGGAKPKRTNARGQMIAKMMREKGCSLAEASRMLKQQSQ